MTVTIAGVTIPVTATTITTTGNYPTGHVNHTDTTTTTITAAALLRRRRRRTKRVQWEYDPGQVPLLAWPYILPP